MRDRLQDLLARAERAGDGREVAQVEVSTSRAAVFCVRNEHWTLAVVAGRFALSSLMFYDLRHVLADLGEPA
jgi:hypothetical protein